MAADGVWQLGCILVLGPIFVWIILRDGVFRETTVFRRNLLAEYPRLGSDFF